MPSKDYEGPDRREDSRVRGVVVEYTYEGSISTSDALSFTKDLSKKGICIVIDKDIPKGTVLSLKIYLPNQPEPILAQAKTVWADTSPYLNTSISEKTYYDLGLEFTEIDDASNKKLFTYIERNKPSKE